MTILETIKGIIEHEEAEQKMRESSKLFRNGEILKFKNLAKGEESRKKEIEEEIKENDIQIQELKKIKEQLEEALCGVQESQK